LVAIWSHASLQFLIKAPIFVARQLVKHQVGLVWNEVSRRYVDDEPEFYLPFMWRERAEDKKQGSADSEVEYDITDITHACKTVYNDMLEKNIAPEMARMILPQNMMTEWYWSGTLYAFARVCNLRNKPDSQEETRMITGQMAKHMKDHFPVSTKYLLRLICMAVLKYIKNIWQSKTILQRRAMTMVNMVERSMLN
jgi:thymidylate synthase (FAD)